MMKHAETELDLGANKSAQFLILVLTFFQTHMSLDIVFSLILCALNIWSLPQLKPFPLLILYLLLVILLTPCAESW